MACLTCMNFVISCSCHAPGLHFCFDLHSFLSYTCMRPHIWVGSLAATRNRPGRVSSFGSVGWLRQFRIGLFPSVHQTPFKWVSRWLLCVWIVLSSFYCIGMFFWINWVNIGRPGVWVQKKITVIPYHFAVHLSRTRYFVDFHNDFLQIVVSVAYVHKTASQIYIKLDKLSCNF